MYRPQASSYTSTSTFQDFVTAFNTGNYDQAAGLFATDGQFMAPHKEPAHGPKAIERVLREFGEAGYQDLRLETLRIEHSADLAAEIGRYTMGRTQPNGTTVVERGKYLIAWRRLGTWLMIANCWNSNLPVAG